MFRAYAVFLILVVTLSATVLAFGGEAKDIRILPGHPEWPRAWVTYNTVKSFEEDIIDLKAHGVRMIRQRPASSDEAKTALDIARREDMKYHFDFQEITERADLVRQEGIKPVPALAIGGVYKGKAIDRHLFKFTAARHRIVIEQPVYNKVFAYTRPIRNGTGSEQFAHYFKGVSAPVLAEVVVPLKLFDGTQHLKILPATITEAPNGTLLELDSVTVDMTENAEIKNRKLYLMSFDLTGFDNAMLDKIGLAVYWQCGGWKDYWMFGRGSVSAWAKSTKQALRSNVRKELQKWIDANGGTFPHDIVLAARFGDECFYVTGHLNGPAASYPLWEYSRDSIEAFRAKAGLIEYPRTWGFLEIYGADAYAWWLYNLHEGCANICAIVREEIAKQAPGLMLFRNQTRNNVFSLANDHDGSGMELLTRSLDIVHLDPYPVSAGFNGSSIVRDMSYCAGLARRYNKLLIPWMQAHTYLDLQHVSPDDVDRMAQQHIAHGVDAIIWLGYGNNTETFPLKRPESWHRAGEFHKRLNTLTPTKRKAKLAVLRHYRTWAQSSLWEGKMRNPADWMLQRFLDVWAVKYDKPYDVFELPPALSLAEEDKLKETLKQYAYIVSTRRFGDAWVIGIGTETTAVDLSISIQLKKQFEEQLKTRRWLDALRN